MAFSDSTAHALSVETDASSHPDHTPHSPHVLSRVMAIPRRAADVAASALGMLTSTIIATRIHVPGLVQLSSREQIALVVGAGLLAMLLQSRQHPHVCPVHLSNICATEDAIRIAMPLLLVLVAVGLVLNFRGLLPLIVIAVAVMPLLLIVENQLLHAVDRAICHRDRVTNHVSTVFKQRQAGGGLTVVAHPTSHRARVLVLPNPHSSAANLRATASARQDGVETPSGALAHDGQQQSAEDLSGSMLGTPLHSNAHWGYETAKRGMDILLSCLLLVLLAPLVLLIALVICLDSPGTVLFVQQRVGLDGRLFNIYKFRSMYSGVPRYQVSPASSHDPRITRVGRFLRRTSLDELPQLMNVLRGEMSMVGPRPEMPFIVEHYNVSQRQRLQVTPGITGLWQLSVDRSSQIHENLHYDLSYIRNRTFYMDIAILMHTLFFAMRGI
jgi:lipopolysaccharide/colanic/teichoic acid biosynthesis glycosyltransferase